MYISNINVCPADLFACTSDPEELHFIAKLSGKLFKIFHKAITHNTYISSEVVKNVNICGQVCDSHITAASWPPWW